MFSKRNYFNANKSFGSNKADIEVMILIECLEEHFR